MSESPQVTVAMAAYNAAPTVRAAIESIRWQSFADWELVVADDGSTDQTARIVQGIEDHRIRLIGGGANRGKPARMNEIIARARAPLLAIMDADDIALPDRLAAQVHYLNEYRAVDLLATGMATFDEAGSLGLWRRLGTHHRDIVRYPWLGFHFNSPTWMGRTAWFRHHLYREDLRAAEDEDLLLRSYKSSNFAGIPDLHLAYRIDLWSWAKARRMRRDHVRALLSASGKTPLALAGTLVHGAKIVREGLAIATGLSGRVLEHRSLPLSADESVRIAELLDRVGAIR